MIGVESNHERFDLLEYDKRFIDFPGRHRFQARSIRSHD